MYSAATTLNEWMNLPVWMGEEGGAGGGGILAEALGGLFVMMRHVVFVPQSHHPLHVRRDLAARTLPLGKPEGAGVAHRVRDSGKHRQAALNADKPGPARADGRGKLSRSRSRLDSSIGCLFSCVSELWFSPQTPSVVRLETVQEIVWISSKHRI